MYLTIDRSDSILSVVRLLQSLGFSDDVISKSLEDMLSEKKKSITIDIDF